MSHPYQRSRGRPRRWSVAATAGIAATLLTTAAPAGADTYIDPGDRCLPGAEAPPAPVSDRDQVDPVHLASVDCVFAQGISVGTGNGTYMPEGMTRRDQMASFIVRALEAAGYDVPAAGDQGFTDIDVGSTVVGLIAGKTQTTYAPAAFVRREQMASFLVRVVDMTLEVE